MTKTPVRIPTQSTFLGLTLFTCGGSISLCAVALLTAATPLLQAPQLQRSLIAGAVGTAASLVVAFFMAARLQRAIYEPFFRFLDKAKGISRQRNYPMLRIRAPEEQLSELAGIFNDQIDLLEHLDRQLGRLQESEEEKVAQRTAALLEETRAAQAADRAKSQLLATVSHEIRTNLNGMLGMTELLLASDLPELPRGYAQTAQRSGTALLCIVNDILDRSGVEAGKLDLATAPFRPGMPPAGDAAEAGREPFLAGPAAGGRWLPQAAADAEAALPVDAGCVPPPRGPEPCALKEPGTIIEEAALNQLRALERGVPNLLSEVISSYLAEAPKHLAAMRRAIVDAAAGELRSAAHTFKSSSTLIGARTLADLCQSMEAAGLDDPFLGAEELLARIESEFAQVNRILSAIQEEENPAT